MAANNFHKAKCIALYGFFYHHHECDGHVSDDSKARRVLDYLGVGGCGGYLFIFRPRHKIL
jgi:hypothetical protein